MTALPNEAYEVTPVQPIPGPKQPETLPCEACGTAVPDPSPRRRIPDGDRVRLGIPKTTEWQRFGWCEACSVVRDAADEYVTEHPGLAGRFGPQIARQNVEDVMFAFKLLGKPVPDDLGFALPRMLPAARVLRYHHPGRFLTTSKPTTGSGPWSHVNDDQRVALKRADADLFADRLALSKPNVAIRCPSGACMMCGVVKVERPAIDVRRRGAEAVAASVWTPVPSSKYAGQHTCPGCTDAIEFEGAIGPSSMLRAVSVHVEHTMSSHLARRLSVEVEQGRISLPMWAETRGASRLTGLPFDHLMKALNLLTLPRGPKRVTGPMEVL